MKTMVIPKDMLPFKVTINGVTYVYEAGTEQEVPDEVAEIIMNRKNDYPPKDEKTEPPFNVGDVEDVQVNGTSVVSEGVATIPIATGSGQFGLFSVNSQNDGVSVTSNGYIRTVPSTDANIDSRNNQFKPITSTNLDYAVKAAMTDGVGAAWTDAERLAALARMGCTVDENGVVHFTAQTDE